MVWNQWQERRSTFPWWLLTPVYCSTTAARLRPAGGNDDDEDDDGNGNDGDDGETKTRFFCFAAHLPEDFVIVSKSRCRSARQFGPL